MIFTDYASSTDDSFDPYNDEEIWTMCKRGCRFHKETRWCCTECWIEQREELKTRRQRTINFIFGEAPTIEATCEEDYPLIECFNILKIAPPKTQEEIKKAYYKQSLKYHPDKCSDADSVTKFQEVNNAYHTLLAVC